MRRQVMALVMAASVLWAGQAYAFDNVRLTPFVDVTGSEWFGDEVYALSALGTIDGYEDGTFRPEGKLTREAFIKLVMASHVEGLAPVQPTGGPSDVDSERWSYPYIASAFDRHWIDPLLDERKSFSPERPLTREEAAAVIGRSLLTALPLETQTKWRNGEWTNVRDERSFKDSQSISEKLSPDLYYAVRQGIMEGDDDGFRPQDGLNRKEAAAILYRVLDKQAENNNRPEVTGFYAIRSYPAIDKLPLLSDVSFGWSRLRYDGPGKGSLTTDTTEYKIPDGWKDAVGAANQAKLPKELMVYGNGDSLKAFLKDEAAIQAFIDSLLTVLRDSQYGFSGVTLDFEGLKEETSASDYSSFLNRLKKKLDGLSLSVAVPPAYYYKGYDLAAIGKMADRVILMAYDFTHEESRLPSAPLPLVSDAVKRTLQSVPKEKLVLGLSKQANQWVSSGGMSELYNPEIADVEVRMQDPTVTKLWMLPYFLKELTFSDSRGSHDIFYEDTESIGKKVWLAKVYGLRGISLWHMGNFTDTDWNMFRK